MNVGWSAKITKLEVKINNIRFSYHIFEGILMQIIANEKYSLSLVGCFSQQIIVLVERNVVGNVLDAWLNTIIIYNRNTRLSSCDLNHFIPDLYK